MADNRKTSARRFSSFLAALALIAFAFPATQLNAQEPAKPATSAEKSSEPKAEEKKPGAVAEGIEKVKEAVEKEHETAEKEKKSAEEEGKETAGVKALAKWTGLSTGQVYWISVLLNFGIIAFFIFYMGKKKLPGAFRDRTSAIQKGMEEARKASEDARKRLSDVESRLSNLDSEIAKMRADAAEMGKAEEQRILAEGEAERKRIVAAAEQEIGAAAGSARRELKAYAAELAVDLAMKKIRVEKTADQELVREFTAGLGKDGN
jgi:F-type H+-transporting ATPase subunit b